MHLPSRKTEPLPRGATALPIWRVDADAQHACHDAIAIEEPLETRLIYHRDGRRRRQAVAVTMRTPGNDVELALGFLFGEGIIDSRDAVRVASHFGPAAENGLQNTVHVELNERAGVDLQRLKRNFYTTSSCGVCGKASLEAVSSVGCATARSGQPRVAASLIQRLPSLLRDAQAVFASTGGLHAAALFDACGQLHGLREDVGRHNAVDKLIGRQLLDGRLPSDQHLLVLSGRASFELLQKAARGGIPIVVAIGAPSSLAVALAHRYGITLIGFARSHRFNIYSAPERILGATECPSASSQRAATAP